jgi:CPA2 family monovalent cation:H+ antiporter-2
MHLPIIIQDLAIILIVAGAMTLLFRAIRQPVVLGYIVAGFLVGPNFEWFPTVIGIENIKVWADIGVIFLLFALGLEFSFKKLSHVGTPALLTALVEVTGMIGVGYLTGKIFGWNNMDSMFLGGILAISSTTIIIRAFDELDLKTRGFVNLVIGILIAEDLVAILLMVLLSTIAVSQTFSGVEMGIAGLKLGFFLTLWFILGIFLIPSFLKKVRKFLGRETLLIVSLGLCFLMVVLATKVGFSPALGAFIMGSILAETIEGEKIEHLIHPVKDLFGAIFFVSVGMLINAQVLVDYAVPILAITAVTIIGKLITTTAGSLLSGQSLRHSIQAGMSLAQIGEFSFIIAGLGLSLKVTSDFLYPIAISVSAITTFTTPYLIRSSDPLVYFIERKLPKKWRIKFESFRTASASVSQTSDWKILLKKSLMKIITNAVAVVALFLLVSEFLHPWLITQEWNPQLTEGVSLAIAFVLSAPILWAIVGGQFGGEAASALWSERRFTGPLFIFEMFRWIFATFLVTVLAIRIVAPSFILVAICILVIATVYWIPRYFEQIYEWLESWFVINFNEKETHSNKKSLPPLAPWDSHLAELTVSSDSSLIGRKLSELTIREKFGVTIALIERGKKVIPAPGRNDMLYPADVLQVIGSDEQINAFRYECEASAVALSEPPDFVYGLRSVYIDTTSPYVNKTIRDCGLREQTHGLVVGIEQNGKRILNPDSATIIHTGNVLWVVGDKKLMADI